MKKLLFIITCVYALSLGISCYAKDLVTERDDLSTKIEQNTQTVTELTTIQDSLHSTAELLRNSEHYDEELVNQLSAKWMEVNSRKQDLIYNNDLHQRRLDEINEFFNNYNYKGLFELTAYCQGTITSTGTTPKANHTIAVDPKVIPYGSKVYIEGYGFYVAEDCGGAVKGNIIDIYMPGYNNCIQFGRRHANVYIVK